MIGSKAYFGQMIAWGARCCWLFTYMPIGNEAVPELMVSAEQRRFKYEQVRRFRQTKPLFTLDFWNDGEHSGGCLRPCPCWTTPRRWWGRWNAPGRALPICSPRRVWGIWQGNVRRRRGHGRKPPVNYGLDPILRHPQGRYDSGRFPLENISRLPCVQRYKGSLLLSSLVFFISAFIFSLIRITECLIDCGLTMLRHPNLAAVNIIIFQSSSVSISLKIQARRAVKLHSSMGKIY